LTFVPPPELGGALLELQPTASKAAAVTAANPAITACVVLDTCALLRDGVHAPDSR
jgi:hypothetical protein